MAIDMPALPEVSVLIAPQEIDKRKGGRGSGAAVAIGTILILSDGSECVVAAFDAQGNPLCHPVGD